MQSLGKVPSARRPPANLPSLKAETSTPNDNSWGESDALNQQHTASTANQAAAGIGGNEKPVKSTANGPHSGPPSLNNSAYSNSSSNQGGGGSGGNGSATWNAISTGGQIDPTPASSLYQNPQFQQEFPSLDGSGAPTSKGGRGAANDTQHSGGGGGDGQQLSLRPQTDASQWQQNQQQQQNHQQQQNQQHGQNSQTNQPAPAPQLPPQLRAVMPSFMYRSSGGAQGQGAGNAVFGGYAPNTNQYGLPDEQNAMNYNSSSGAAQQPFNKRSSGAGGSGGQRRGGNDDDYGHRNERRGGDRDRYDRPPRRGPPPNRSNRHDPYEDDYVEPKFSGKYSWATKPHGNYWW